MRQPVWNNLFFYMGTLPETLCWKYLEKKQTILIRQ